MPDLRKLRTLIKPSNVDNGDGMPADIGTHASKTLTNSRQAISSIILAVEMIVQYCRKLKYKKRIILVTNGRSPMDSDGLDAIVSKLQSENIELIVL